MTYEIKLLKSLDAGIREVRLWHNGDKKKNKRAAETIAKMMQVYKYLLK